RHFSISRVVPETSRQKCDATRDRFPDAPIPLKNASARLGEGTLAAHLNELLRHYPALLLGSYPEFSNPEYRVKVTLESRDQTYLEAALAVFVKGLPGDAVVKIT